MVEFEPNFDHVQAKVCMTSAKLERKKFLSTLKFGESHVNFGLYLVKICHNFYDQDWQTLKDQNLA